MPENFHTDYELNEVIVKTKVYYISLDQDGIERVETFDSDVSYQYNFRIIPVANDKDKMFLGLIDLFQYAPILFDISLKGKTQYCSLL